MGDKPERERKRSIGFANITLRRFRHQTKFSGLILSIGSKYGGSLSQFDTRIHSTLALFKIRPDDRFPFHKKIQSRSSL